MLEKVNAECYIGTDETSSTEVTHVFRPKSKHTPNIMYTTSNAYNIYLLQIILSEFILSIAFAVHYIYIV